MNKKIFFTLSLLSILVILSGCGGGGGGGSVSAPPGTNPGVPSVIKLLDVQNIAQTNSSIYLKAKVLDGNGKPVINQPVYFTIISGVGTLSAASINTDANGIATVTLNSTVSGFSTVLAEITAGAGQIRDRRTVYFTANIKFEAAMSLSVDSVPGDGLYNQSSDFILFESTSDNTVEVLATVFDVAGFPAGGGWPVSWVADHAEAVFIRTDTITDLNGQARAIIQVIPETLRATETSLNIGASAGNGAFNMVTLFLKPVTVNSVVVTANPSTVDSGGTSVITAYVTTTAGSPVPDGTIVSFTATGGGGVDAPFAQTDGGIATTTLTAPTVTVNTTVTASVGGKTGSAFVSVIAPVIPPTPIPLTLTASVLAVDGNAGGTVNFTVSGGASTTYTSTSANPSLVFNDNGIGTGGVANDGVRESGESGVWTGSSFTATIESCTPAGTVVISATDGTTTVTKTITIQNLAGTTAANRPTIAPATATINEGPTVPINQVYNVTQGAGAALTTLTGTVSNATVIDLTPVGAQAAAAAAVVAFTAEANPATITTDTTVNLLFTNNLGCKAGATVRVINEP